MERNSTMSRAEGTASQGSFLDLPLSKWLTPNWEKVLWVLILVLAVATRLWDLGSRAQHHDESMHAFYSWELFQGRGYTHNPLLHGPTLFHITALMYFLFGTSDYTSRLGPAIFGVALVMMPYFLKKWLGRFGALAASFMLLISPGILYYSRSLRHDLFALLAELVVFLAIIKYLDEKRNLYLYLLAGAQAFLFSTHEVAYITTFIFGTFLWLVLALREVSLLPSLAHEPPSSPFVRSVTSYTLVSAALAPVAVPLLLFIFSQGLPAGAQGIMLIFLAFLASLTLPGLLIFLALPALSILRRITGAEHSPNNVALQDVTILILTLALPLVSALVINLLHWGPADYSPAGLVAYLQTWTGIAKCIPVVLVFLGISVAIGIAWDRSRWLKAAGIYYAIYLLLHTAFLTSMSGVVTSTVGALGYWLSQQGVQRGGQPWYYFLVLLPLYEFLPLLLASLGVMRYLFAAKEAEASLPIKRLFSLFLIYWLGLAFVIHSYAGEKMPWHIIYLALPAILLAGSFLGDMLRGMDWAVVKRGWPIFPLMLLALAILLLSLSSTLSLGAQLEQLGTIPWLSTAMDLVSRTMFWLRFVVILAIPLSLVVVYARRVGRATSLRLVFLAFVFILALFTVRYAWIASYIHGDIAKDMLIYTQTSPDVTMVMKELDDLSQRLVGSKEMMVAFDDLTSWPLYWYLRDYPNRIYLYPCNPPACSSPTLKGSERISEAPVVFISLDNERLATPYLSDYVRQQYHLRWWFPEDYRGWLPENSQEMTLDGIKSSIRRIVDALKDPELRRSLLQFLIYRELDKPLGSTDFVLYIRKDIVSKLWRSSAITITPETVLDEYTKKKIEVASVLTFGGPGADDGQFNFPKDLAIDSEGNIYVVDSQNNRVQVFDPTGRFLRAWGTPGTGPGQFLEPWGIGIDREDKVYTADTWNHRIQVFDENGTFVTQWGQYADTSGVAREKGGFFFGPRDVTIDAEGNVYVTDTGNERIQKFDENGVFVGQWGGEGSAQGQFREPVGIAIDKNGNICVADTWNRRTQKFDREFGFLTAWPIEGWAGESASNKPYLATDSHGNLYVTDPEGYRVLIFSEEGELLGVFGDYGTDVGSFNLPTGIAVDGEGYIYVADSANHRIAKFKSPFEEISAGPVAPTPPEQAPTAPEQEGMTYIVKPGDTFWKLAEKYLDSGSAWPAIISATNQKNTEDSTYAQIPSAGLIQPGWKLLIPSRHE